MNNEINTSDHRSHAQKAAGLPLKRVSNTLCSNAADKSAHTPTYAELLDALKDCHWQLGTFIESDAWEAADNDAYDKGAIVIAKAENFPANTRLIAAAPDLLKVCKLMIARLKGDIAIKAFDAIRQGGMLPSLYAEAETAIQKAEGSAQ